jgi:hypothetical protein
MRQLLRFALLLAPYAAFVAVCPVISAAFLIPNVAFETVGSLGLAVAVAIATVSLITIVRTDRTFLDAGRRVNQEYVRSRNAEKKS